MLSFRFALYVVIFILLSACTNAPRIAKAHYVSHFNFAQVKTYSFYGRNDERFDYQNLSDVIRNSIEFALEKQLDQQGFIYKNIDQADVIISYFWVADPKQVDHQEKHERKMRSRSRHNSNNEKKVHSLGFRGQLKKYNQGVRYCSACLKLSTDGDKKSTISSGAGSLIVDLISSKTQQTIWRSSYPVIVDDKDNSREIQQRIQRAIEKMLLQYPKS